MEFSCLYINNKRVLVFVLTFNIEMCVLCSLTRPILFTYFVCMLIALDDGDQLHTSTIGVFIVLSRSHSQNDITNNAE